MINLSAANPSAVRTAASNAASSKCTANTAPELPDDELDEELLEVELLDEELLDEELLEDELVDVKPDEELAELLEELPELDELLEELLELDELLDEAPCVPGSAESFELQAARASTQISTDKILGTTILRQWVYSVSAFVMGICYAFIHFLVRSLAANCCVYHVTRAFCTPFTQLKRLNF